MISKSKRRVVDFAIPMLESLDTARSLSWAISLRYSRDTVLDVLELPMHFGPFDAERVRREYESYMLLRKMPDLWDTDLRGVAVEAFLKAEEQCKFVNSVGMAVGRLTRDNSLEHRMTRVLAELLGPAPTLSTLSKLANWGPGATYDLSRKHASPERKTIKENGITLALLNAIAREEPAGFLPPESYSLTPGGRIETVAKSVKTDRTIVIEPGINAYFQSGLGSFIRSRLRKFGIDLRNAAEHHRVRCMTYWSTIATIDLAAASDTISSWLLTLFPMEWYFLIDLLRSPRARLDADWIELQKVSSMGNGFTFELETLIFLAVCLASGVDLDQASVFGDDIIVPRDKAPIVVENLTALGFRINQDKTFLEGDFVESCGVHCWKGIDLSPFQLKEEISDGLQAIDLANKVRAFSWLSTDGAGCDRRYLHVWRLCLRWIPDALQPARGPFGFSGTLWCNYREVAGLSYANNMWHVGGRAGLVSASYRTKPSQSSHPRLLQHRLRQLPDAWDVYIPVYGSRLIEPCISKFVNPGRGSSYGNTCKIAKRMVIALMRFDLSQGWVQPGDWIVPAP